MTSKTKAALCMALIVMLVTVYLPLPTKAAVPLEAPVRVGYYEDGDYMYANAQGEYEGYNFEFLLGLSKLSGIRYEVINAGSWQNAMQLLIDGEIDILPAVYRTKEREGKMLFPDQAMCNIYTTLNVRAEDIQYRYEDFDAFQGMQVGIIKGGEDGESFKAYCAEHGIDLEIVDYEETSDLLGALEDGTLDGVAITHLGRNSDFRSVAQFAPNPLYLAISNKRPDLLAIINRANNDILLRDPGYQMDLYDKYLAPSAEQRPVFTKEEIEYIKSSGTVQVGYDPSFAPLTYQGKTGGFSGVLAEFFALIAEDSGLSFEFEATVPTASLDQISKGEQDVVCVIDSDYLWDERHNMSTTLYYLRAPSMRITKEESEKIETLALVDGYRLSEWVAKNAVEQKILYFSSAEECFDAILNGNAQATYANTYVASYLLTKEKYKSLHSNTISQYTSDLCIGVSKSADPRLFSILDKYIQSMAGKQMDELLLKHSASMQTVSIAEFVRQHLWVVMMFFSGIIFLLCIYLRNISRSRHRIQELLWLDGLTGLDNLNRFYITATGLICATGAGSYALAYCDIDQFKLINDNFGFEEGDRILCAYGKTLQQAIGEKECCARISADNFVLLMEANDWSNLEIRLEQIRENINDWRKKRGILPYEIFISVGIYRVVEAEKNDIHRMIDLANYARRSAKESVVNDIVCYDENMRKKALMEQELEDRLFLALENQEFEVYYQPKVEMGTGAIVGSEALVRWNHPAHGLLMPGSFIPLFEKNGVVVQVDIYVYGRVCSDIRRWIDQGVDVYPVSCNFSQVHFGREGFVERVAEIADLWKIPHYLLEIEITESTIASDTENLDAILAEFKKLGFLITIDDFGSGYSSLGQLQRLQADVLKLDRSFVSRGLQGKREQIVIENLINMGKELEMAVICEGVETIEQAQALQKMGCRFAQGFYYHHPMPVMEFEGLIYKL